MCGCVDTERFALSHCTHSTIHSIIQLCTESRFENPVNIAQRKGKWKYSTDYGVLV